MKNISLLSIVRCMYTTEKECIYHSAEEVVSTFGPLKPFAKATDVVL